MNTTKILIVDDHQVVLEGIASLLSQLTKSQNIMKAQSGADALNLAHCNSIDVAVIDYCLPDIDGASLVNRLRGVSPETHTVIFTEHDELWVIKEIAKAHPDAVVLKSDDMHELVIAVESACIGLSYHSSRFKEIINEAGKTFTPREIEILQHVSQGRKSREIAESLCVSENTVEYHRKKLMRSLGAMNNAHLATIAIAAGLVRPTGV